MTSFKTTYSENEKIHKECWFEKVKTRTGRDYVFPFGGGLVRNYWELMRHFLMEVIRIGDNYHALHFLPFLDPLRFGSIPEITEFDFGPQPEDFLVGVNFETWTDQYEDLTGFEPEFFFKGFHLLMKKGLKEKKHRQVD